MREDGYYWVCVYGTGVWIVREWLRGSWWSGSRPYGPSVRWEKIDERRIERLPSPPPEPLFLIWNVRDERVGWNDGCMVFWRENDSGYSNHIDDAGRFTLEKATKITSGSHNELKMVPLATVMNVAKTRTYVWLHDLEPRT